MCVSCSIVSNSLWPPQTVACQASLSLEFSRQEYWSGFPFSSPEELPNPGNEPWSPASKADSLLFELQGSVQFSSVQSLSRVRLFATPWIAARQASLFITISRSSLRLRSVESVMPSSHLILGCPLLLLLTIPPSIRVFSNESTLHMRWPKYWSFSFSKATLNQSYRSSLMSQLSLERLPILLS